MPQDPNIIATHGQDNSLYIFDTSKDPAEKAEGEVEEKEEEGRGNDAVLELTGHKDEG